MCIILYTKIGESQVLAKNRDRVYRPKIRIIHEVVNGLEVVYLRDEITGWMEGMNAKGDAMVNATMGRMDGKYPIKSLQKKKNIIYQMLTRRRRRSPSQQYFFSLFPPTGGENREGGLEGNTLFATDNLVFHMENTNQENVRIEQVHSTQVYSNHGILLKTGFRTGKKGLSSFLRRRLVQEELKQDPPKNILELAQRMNRMEKKVDPRFQPYRDRRMTKKRLQTKNPTPIIGTTGQLIMDITKKEFYYFRDKNNSQSAVYSNRLPRDWIPQIRVHLFQTQKDDRKSVHRLSQKYLKRLTRCMIREKKPIEICGSNTHVK